MLKRLRRKFIFINMSLVTAVLAIVLVLLCFYNQRQAIAESYIALAAVLESDSFAPFFRQTPTPEGETRQPFLPAFCVSVDATGEISQVIGNNAQVEAGLAQAAAAQALALDENSAVLPELGLRYLRQASAAGQKIAFVDMASERDAVRRVLRLFLPVGGLGLLIFFGISVFLSRWALGPVERAWQQQRRFVADASHELKTPLTVILANLQIMQELEPGPQQSNWLRNTYIEAEQMRELTENLLFLARSEQEGPGGSRELLDMSRLAANCVLSFDGVAYERGLLIESRLSPGLSCQGDQTELRRCLAVLLDNACKYCDEAGWIRVTLIAVGDKLAFSVANSGPLIPAAQLPHLCERFYRADGSRSSSGYGLGLAIARQIALNHQGSLSVTSSQAEGTVFTLSLPRK